MQAVILAAGRGTRMGKLTEEFPKGLLSVCGKTLLEHKLDALPESIDEVLLVIQHRGDLIQQHFGDAHKGKKITYIVDQTLSGTAHALWQCKDSLHNRFLVMMGDDIYDKASLHEVCQYDFAIVCKKVLPAETGSRIILDDKGSLLNFVTDLKYKENHSDGGLVFTGLYALTTDIFNYEPVKMKTKEEWGLPQTLLPVSKDHHIQIVETDFWISVNNENELEFAEKTLSAHQH